MSTTRDRAEEMLATSHERLLDLLQQAREEAVRIQTLDEVLGTETLVEIPSVPLSVDTRRAAPSLPQSSKSPAPPKKKAVKAKKRKARKKGGPTIADRVEKILRAHPGRSFSVSDLVEATGGDVKRQVMQATMKKLHQTGTPWLRRKADGRRVSYSLAPNQSAAPSGE